MSHQLRLMPSTWDADAAFAYMSDFSNAQIWDPGVVRARRIDDGPISVGSAFELEVKFGPRTSVMRYEVTRLVSRSVTFRAVLGAVRSEDTITVEETTDGCTVSYDAGIEISGAGAILNPALALVFRRVVDRAATSLGAILMESE